MFNVSGWSQRTALRHPAQADDALSHKARASGRGWTAGSQKQAGKGVCELDRWAADDPVSDGDAYSGTHPYLPRLEPGRIRIEPVDGDPAMPKSAQASLATRAPIASVIQYRDTNAQVETWPRQNSGSKNTCVRLQFRRELQKSITINKHRSHSDLGGAQIYPIHRAFRHGLGMGRKALGSLWLLREALFRDGPWMQQLTLLDPAHLTFESPPSNLSIALRPYRSPAMRTPTPRCCKPGHRAECELEDLAARLM